MKDLSSFYEEENYYAQQNQSSGYEKDIKQDIKRLNKKKYIYRGYLAIPVSLAIYVPISLLLNIHIFTIIIWSCYLIANSISIGYTTSRDRRKLLSSSLMNLKDLAILLLRNDVDVGNEDLKKSIITEKKTKDKVEYRNLGDKKKTLNHTFETSERIILFKDRKEQIQCLKEVREIIKEQGKKTEETRKVYLLEPQDFEKESIDEAKIMKLKKGN